VITDIRKVRAMSSAIKVLVSGAYATGKTTLCWKVCEQLDAKGVSWKLVSEVSRRCPFLLNRDQTFLASAWLIGAQIREESEQMVGDHSVLICDRGVPDILSHTTVIEPFGDSDKRLREIIIRVCREWGRSYDAIFATTIDAARGIEVDCMRVPDRDYRRLLEQSIFDALTMMDVAPTVLPRGTDERVSIVVDYIKRRLSLAGCE
jgi:GTPase SAR1 family protein